MLSQTTTLSYALWFLLYDCSSDIDMIALYLGAKSKKPSHEDLKTSFEKIAKSNIGFLNLCFLDNNGTLKEVYPKKYSAQLGNNYSFRNYFKKVQETNKLVMSEPLNNRRMNGEEPKFRSIVLIAPIFNLKNEKIGYLLSDIDVSNLGALIQLEEEISHENYPIFYIINPTEKALMFTPHKEYPQPLTSKNKFFRSFLIDFASADKKEQSILTNILDETVYLSSRKIDIDNNQFSVTTILPYKFTIDHLADYNRKLALIVIYLGLIFVLVTSLVAYNRFVIRRLKKKINRLEIIIDKKIKKLEVNNIVDSKYFEELKNKIKKS